MQSIIVNYSKLLQSLVILYR